MEREREVEIECVQNYRNVFMIKEIEKKCRDIERVYEERHKRTSSQQQLGVRVKVWVRLSGILSCFSFPGILSSTITLAFVQDSIWFTPQKSTGNH